MLSIPGWHWAILIGWFSLLLILDLVVFHRKDKEPSLKAAIWQTVMWISLGVALGFVMWPLYGAKASSEYFSGFLIEKSLSIDNVFVWAVIFGFFKIPRKYQHRILFWGIFGALVLRAIFIFAGVAILQRFEAAFLILGGLLIFSGINIFVGSGEQFDPETSRGIKLLQKIVPISKKLNGHHFFITENGKKHATILLLALLAIEFTDVIFAADSVPAILAVAQDPFIIFASNAAAILGLRALYFVFDVLKDKFWLLNKGLGIILLGVGAKMLVSPSEVLEWPWFGYHVSTNLSLALILLILAASITASLVITPKSKSD
ncbi:MAG: TerC/Alx family metal homeostasis membrane protein [Candidatus Saccharimonadales bacterium]